MEQIINNYISTFLGYGDPTNRFWYIGMEEGGGAVLNQIIARFQQWNARGQRPTEDLPQFCEAIGITAWFQQRARLQPTWQKLIRVFLKANGVEPTREIIRQYQTATLGRIAHDGSLFLAELMPLPSPSLNDWPYEHLNPNLKFLANRMAYCNKVRPMRIRLVQQKIREYQPLIVCFYGQKYQNNWEAIAGTDFTVQLLPGVGGIRVAKNNQTHYYLHPHPTSHGVTNAYLNAVGQFIRHQG